MKLITETIDSIDFLVENTSKGKTWSIEGKMIHGGIRENRNRRIYEMDSVLRPATQKYITEYVNTKRSLGDCIS